LRPSILFVAALALASIAFFLSLYLNRSAFEGVPTTTFFAKPCRKRFLALL
jgi:hypothetical protein